MIEQISIQNFQTHDKLRIDFDPGITTIVGPSDCGKSAIIRALRWVCTNRPGGDAFVRYGSKGCTVQVVVDGQAITRRRSPGGSVNTYHLGDKEFKAFGVDVPEPIQEHLNIGAVCWQQQHDAPYWFSDSAGEVSRQLNAIVNLSIIDETMAGVAKTLNKAKTKVTVCKEALAKAKKEAEDLQWVPAFVAAVDTLEAASEAHIRARENTSNAVALLTAAKTHSRAVKRMTAVAKLGDSVVVAGNAAIEADNDLTAILEAVARAKHYAKQVGAPVPSIVAVEKAWSQYTKTSREAADLKREVAAAKRYTAQMGSPVPSTMKIEEAWVRYNAVGGSLVTMRNDIERAKRYAKQVGAPVPSTVAIDAAWNKHIEAEDQHDTLIELLNTIKDKKEAICRLQKQLEAAESALPKVCPVCGRS